ncbi:MAG TPA: 2-C-methyl-D-erythritol 4-phosphate cytidylyltransferase [Casimicrobiaceae bacterium]|nr:2-C-methyl-D-erythritol 4-phosphate cytidylyltransferase [Casimicrobiaceae bacterium]
MWIVVPAAGTASRFGGSRPKQYAALAGAPMIQRTLERLATLGASAIVVALAPDDTQFERVVPAQPGVEALRCGGETRAATVRNALAALAGRCRDDDWILVHDAARPCVPRDALRRLVDAIGNDRVGGLLALPLADTLKRADASAETPRVLRTEDRRSLWLAQTPQMFRYRILVDALARDREGEATDEAQAVEALAATGACPMPRLVPGSPLNLKVTWPDDLALAAKILEMQGEP